MIGLVIATYLYVTSEYTHLPKQPWHGVAQFEITGLSPRRTSYGADWCYTGTLSTPDGYKNIPCQITLNSKEERPLANRSYLIKGQLKQGKKGGYYFLTDKKTPWKAVKNSWSFAEMRYQAKKAVTGYIRKQINDKRSADFLAGLATGTFEDPFMSHEFGRFGLQHIMAISGFHFAIIASVLALFLRFLIPERLGTPLLILLLSTYFVFLGDSPSVMRAWITILVGLVAIALERRAFGLNSLGMAILIIMIYNPRMSQSIGFQFSTLSTGAILLFYPLFNELLSKVFSPRPLSEMIEMKWVDQHGYMILTTFKQAFALALAVNIVAFPAMLFYFQKFPYLSLLFNLFFPFLVSISMLLLIIGLILGPLGGWIHSLNSLYTHFSLNFLYGMPATMDHTLYATDLPSQWLIGLLTLTFLGGIFLMDRKRFPDHPRAKTL